AREGRTLSAGPRRDGAPREPDPRVRRPAALRLRGELPLRGKGIPMNVRRRFAVLPLAAAVAAAAAVSAPLSAADLVDRVIARVNDAIITQSELDTRVERARKDPQAPTDLNRLRLVVLQQMIRGKLIEAKAAKLEITAGDDEVEDSVNR